MAESTTSGTTAALGLGRLLISPGPRSIGSSAAGSASRAAWRPAVCLIAIATHAHVRLRLKAELVGGPVGTLLRAPDAFPAGEANSRRQAPLGDRPLDR